MLHGQPHCKRCDYHGPDFMWMWHHMWGFAALIQHRDSLELRTVEVPDDEVFYHRDGRMPGERERESERYAEAVIAGQLREGERHVPPSEFVRFADEGDSQPVTDLPCPRCRSPLEWRHTGIS